MARFWHLEDEHLLKNTAIPWLLARHIVVRRRDFEYSLQCLRQLEVWKGILTSPWVCFFPAVFVGHFENVFEVLRWDVYIFIYIYMIVYRYIRINISINVIIYVRTVIRYTVQWPNFHWPVGFFWWSASGCVTGRNTLATSHKKWET